MRDLTVRRRVAQHLRRLERPARQVLTKGVVWPSVQL
jgi:hypothetical protein